MSKIKRKKAARGTRLAPQQVWSDGLTNIATNLNSANVAGTEGMIVPQYEKQNGTFRLNFMIPYIGSEWTRNNGVEKPYVIPFMLPPLQEFWDVEGKSSDATPSVMLTEFSFGFDQRDEGGLITDQFANNWGQLTANLVGATSNLAGDAWGSFTQNLNHGKIYTQDELLIRGADGTNTMAFHVLQKNADYYGGNLVSNKETMQEIYKLPLNIASFISAGYKTNPYSETNLSINIDPYKTYMLGITPFVLHSDAATLYANLAMVNINVSLKFKHVLVTRDSNIVAAHHPCNMPGQGNLKNQDNVTLTVPAAGSPIEAETGDGLQTSTTTLDKTFREKLQGGLNALSDRGTVEHLCQDAGYEVIAIPMWNNQWGNELTVKQVVADVTPAYAVGQDEPTNNLPGALTGGPSLRLHSTITDMGGDISDRAIIPISFPMTVHHVIVAHNNFTSAIDNRSSNLSQYRYYHSPIPANEVITGTTNTTTTIVKHNIGVAVGTGCRGTFYGYRQIAHYEGTLTDGVVDEIRMDHLCTSSRANAAGDIVRPDALNGFSSVNAVPEWRLNYLPLVNQGNAVAPGLYDDTVPPVKATVGTYQNMQDTPMFIGNSFLVPNQASAATAPALTAYKGSSIRTDDESSATEQISADQWIEVRWNVGPSVPAGADLWTGFNTTGESNPANTSGDFSKIISGYGGSWIYIIGKKHTVSDQNLKAPYLQKGVNIDT